MSTSAPRWTSRLAWAGLILGFGFGGFFDGILLHQVLQWHHLLSLVPGEELRRIKAQILWDGLFHVLMYAMSAAGLWLLWRARRQAAAPGAGRRLIAAFLIGFGVWNVVDVVGFHWLLGIHRLRVDVPADDRLRWDLLWLLLFALPPLLAAAWVERRSGGGHGGRAAAASLALLIAAGGVLATRPPPGTTGRAVLFRADVTAPEAFAAIAAVDGRVLWTSADGRLIGAALPSAAAGWRLYRVGALVVGGPGSPAACLSWSAPSTAGRSG
jgi:uncharacterized membrane protein